MPLMSPFKCWRGRADCVSMASVESAPEGTTEDQYADLSFKPVSFVCMGCVSESKRAIPQDAYRLCFVNEATDEMTDNDEQDLTHLQYVISQGMAIVATRRVSEDKLTVMGDEGIISVHAKQSE